MNEAAGRVGNWFLRGTPRHSAYRVLSDTECARLRKVGPMDDKDRALLLLCLGGGLRADEAAHARRPWYDRWTRTVNVPSRDGGWSPKTPAAARSVPIGFAGAEADWLADFLMDNPSGLGLSRVSVHQRAAAMGRRAGLFNLYPTALRAVAATRFAEMGLNARQLVEVMGWKDLKSADMYLAPRYLDPVADVQRAMRDQRVTLW